MKSRVLVMIMGMFFVILVCSVSYAQYIWTWRDFIGSGGQYYNYSNTTGASNYSAVLSGDYAFVGMGSGHTSQYGVTGSVSYQGEGLGFIPPSSPYGLPYQNSGLSGQSSGLGGMLGKYGGFRTQQNLIIYDGPWLPARPLYDVFIPDGSRPSPIPIPPYGQIYGMAQQSGSSIGGPTWFQTGVGGPIWGSGTLISTPILGGMLSQMTPTSQFVTFPTPVGVVSIT